MREPKTIKFSSGETWVFPLTCDDRRKITKENFEIRSGLLSGTIDPEYAKVRLSALGFIVDEMLRYQDKNKLRVL